MVSKRIKFIASLINKDDKVLDIGTDHALLPIYLVKNNITDVADGSDISDTVLDNARRNIHKYNFEQRINLYCSDGIKNVDISKYNTFIIAGMGYFTIKGILESANLNNIDKMIIQANNNHEDLRKFINSIGYKIVQDRYIFDKNKSYLILMVEKGKQKLSEKEYVCGIYDENNIWYYKHITDKYKKLIKTIPDNDKREINRVINYFNEYLSIEKTED